MSDSMESIKALCAVAHSQYTDEEIASQAASDSLTGKVIKFAVRDTHCNEIVIGYVLVSVFCGSEQAIETIKDYLQKARGMKQEGKQ